MNIGFWIGNNRLKNESVDHRAHPICDQEKKKRKKMLRKGGLSLGTLEEGRVGQTLGLV